MEIDRILNFEQPEKDTLLMILSNRMDAMNVLKEGNGAVTVDVWDLLCEDLIKWKNKKTTSFENFSKTF